MNGFKLQRWEAHRLVDLIKERGDDWNYCILQRNQTQSGLRLQVDFVTLEVESSRISKEIKP
jgi:hypothetical protein